jgi:hypothetical protein
MRMPVRSRMLYAISMYEKLCALLNKIDLNYLRQNRWERIIQFDKYRNGDNYFLCEAINFNELFRYHYRQQP